MRRGLDVQQKWKQKVKKSGGKELNREKVWLRFATRAEAKPNMGKLKCG
jgi:hypothetical protein